MKSLAKVTFAALLLATTATAAQAAEYLFYWKYESPTVLRGITLENNALIQDINVGSGYNGGYGMWNDPIDSNFSFAFNITDAMSNLLHTYTISGVQGAFTFNMTFASAAVAPISPVVGPNIIADGSIQSVASFGAGADSYTLAFQTGAAAPVPEPTAWAMLLAGFGLVGYTLRRRSNVVAA
jgi:PEP-CTERM motif